MPTSLAVSMDLVDFTKLLAYLLVISLLFEHSWSSYPDVRIAPVIQQGAHLTASYRRRLVDVPVSKPSPNSLNDTTDHNPHKLPRSPPPLGEPIAATPPAPYTVPPQSSHTSGAVLQEGPSLIINSGRTSYRRLVDVPVSEPSPNSPNDTSDNPHKLPRSLSPLGEPVAATSPAPYTVPPQSSHTSEVVLHEGRSLQIITPGRIPCLCLFGAPVSGPSPSPSDTSDTSLHTPPPPPLGQPIAATPPVPSVGPPQSSHNFLDYPGKQPNPPAGNNKSSVQVIPVAVSIVIGAIVCFAGLFGWFLFRRKKKLKKITDKEAPNLDGPMSAGGAAPGGGIIFDDSDRDPTSNDFAIKLPKRYPYHTLALATSNFNEQNKLGEGGFGPVFKGILEDGKGDVAVKRVSKRAIGAPKQYKAEVKILTRLSHRNLVELLGWCEEDNELLLVYKFMSNGSLNSQLYNKSRLLTWAERYNIVLGLASALNYLHEECEECVLHRDIKPGNILLDSSFNTKLSDFGLARLVDHDISSKYTTLAGTMGYMAPEHIQENRASKESDIYSFGVVLLEIACGRAPFAQKDGHSREDTNLIYLVWDHYGQKEILKVADKELTGKYNGEEMERVMIVGLWCAHPMYTERPTIGHAIKVLKFDAPLPELPPSRPHFLSLFASLSQIRSSTGNSSSTGLSGSGGYVAPSSNVSSSTSDAAAIA